MPYATLSVAVEEVSSSHALSLSNKFTEVCFQRLRLVLDLRTLTTH